MRCNPTAFLLLLLRFRFAFTPNLKGVQQHSSGKTIKIKETNTLCDFTDLSKFRDREDELLHLLRLPYVSISHFRVQCRNYNITVCVTVSTLIRGNGEVQPHDEHQVPRLFPILYVYISTQCLTKLVQVQSSVKGSGKTATSSTIACTGHPTKFYDVLQDTPELQLQKLASQKGHGHIRSFYVKYLLALKAASILECFTLMKALLDRDDEVAQGREGAVHLGHLGQYDLDDKVAQGREGAVRFGRVDLDLDDEVAQGRDGAVHFGRDDLDDKVAQVRDGSVQFGRDDLDYTVAQGRDGSVHFCRDVLDDKVTQVRDGAVHFGRDDFDDKAAQGRDGTVHFVRDDLDDNVAQGRKGAVPFGRIDLDDKVAQGRVGAVHFGRDDLDDKSAHLHDPHEVERLCTRHEVERICTRHEVERLRTRHDVERLCTRHEVERLRTRLEVERLCTRHEVERLRDRHEVERDRDDLELQFLGRISCSNTTSLTSRIIKACLAPC